MLNPVAGFNGGCGFGSFERAQDIFKEFFKEDVNGFGGGFFSGGGMFDNDDDFFFGSRKKKGSNGTSGNRRDPFGSLFSNLGFGFDNDDFFSSPFDRMGGGGRMNMNGFSGGGGPFTSVSTSTIIKNGKKVTVTKTTVGNSDGTSRTEVQETIVDEGGNRKENRYIEGLPQKEEPKQLFIENGGRETKKSRDKKYEKALYEDRQYDNAPPLKTNHYSGMSTGYSNGSSTEKDFRQGTKEYKFTKKR